MSFRPTRQFQRHVVGGVVIEKPRIVIEPNYDRLIRGSRVDGYVKGVGAVAHGAHGLVCGRGGEAVQAIGEGMLKDEAPGSITIGVGVAQYTVAPVSLHFQSRSRRAEQSQEVVVGNPVTLNSAVVLEACDDWTVQDARLGVGWAATPSPKKDTGRQHQWQSR